MEFCAPSDMACKVSPSKPFTMIFACISAALFIAAYDSKVEAMPIAPRAASRSSTGTKPNR